VILRRDCPLTDTFMDTENQFPLAFELRRNSAPRGSKTQRDASIIGPAGSAFV
jgi:hypothetical protein